MALHSTPAILVADTDERFLTQLKLDPRMEKVRLVHVKDAREAHALISDVDQKLLGIFVSPELMSPSWVTVIKSAHENIPLVPIHLIKLERTGSKVINDEELIRLGIVHAVERTLQKEELKVVLDPIMAKFDATQALEIAKLNPDREAPESTAGNEAFRPIRARDFITGTNSFFDVYARTSLGRHLKLSYAGDDFDQDRLVNYLSKGVDYFYIRKEAQRAYLDYCDHMARGLLQEKRVPIGMKQAQLLNAGQELLDFVSAEGMTEEGLVFAQRFSSNLRTILNQLHDTNLSVFGKFMQDTASYEHAVGVSMMSGLLAKELEITSEGPMQSVAIAALFHDFSLVLMPEACRTEDESLMSPAEIAQFREHPMRSAEAIAKLPNANPAAVQAIQQHHMKLKDKGFPPRNATTPVSRIAEIISTCDELCRILKRGKSDPSLDVLSEIEIRIVPYYSRTVIQAFKRVFYPKLE
jgi:response regulator RpfG family c-di-GMP phosphodiesterase